MKKPDREERRRPTYVAAVTTISDVNCKPDGSGMATISAVITITRHAAEMIMSVEVLVDGTNSSSMPVERPTSPSTTPLGIVHTYDWSESGVPCGSQHSVQGTARIELHTTTASAEVDVACPPCEMP